MTRVAAVIGAVAAAVVWGGAAAQAASAGTVAGLAPAAAGSAGYCTSATGVTVVVDFSALGGDIVVRCASGPGGRGYSGLDALQDAGFAVEGTQQYGLQFICRIQGLPSKQDQTCQTTPPTDAYWGYWYAPDGGDWTYSTSSAQGRSTIAGGFEGWAFSVDQPEGGQQPGIDPERPGGPSQPPSSTQPGGGGTPSTRPPTSSPNPGGPGPNQPSTEPPTTSSSQSSSSAPTTRSPSTTAPSSSAAPTKTATGGPIPTKPKPSQTQKPPTTSESTSPTPTPAAPTTSDSQVRVTGELPASASADDGSGSSTATLVGIGVLAVLGLGGGLTAWRRSHRG